VNELDMPGIDERTAVIRDGAEHSRRAAGAGEQLRNRRLVEAVLIRDDEAVVAE